uniref:Uncharacterized protein n=1 Tax=Leptobrachium leishanense TaxID=445787 RepID=A0A8C5QSS4_9ANUR
MQSCDRISLYPQCSDWGGEGNNMERQACTPQIHLQLNLHGNAPATSRWRNPAQPDHGSDESYHGGGRPPPSSNPTHTWRKKYSLVNRCEPAGPAPRVPSNAPSGGDASAPPPLSDGQIRNPKVGVKDPNTAVCPLQVPTTRGGRSILQHVKHRTHPESPSTSAAWQTHPKPLAPAAPPSKATSKASLDVRPPSFPPDKAGPPRGASAKLVYPRVMTASPVAPTSSNARVDPAKRRLVTPHKMFCSPKSIFALQGSAPHASKTPRARKNKYTWVANSAKPGLCGKKSSPLAKKIVSADAVRTKSPTAAVTTKAKKCSIQGKPGTSRNRYRWKANQPSLTPSGPASVLLHLSVPQSTDQGSAPRLQGPSREAGKGLASPAALKASLKDQMPSSYKVKSRTKLIRRRSSSSPTEKKALPLETANHEESLQSAAQILSSSLVHITKHRLRRLPPPKQPDVSRAGETRCDAQVLLIQSHQPAPASNTGSRCLRIGTASIQCQLWCVSCRGQCCPSLLSPVWWVSCRGQCCPSLLSPVWWCCPRSSLLYGGCSCGVCPAGGSAVLRSSLLYGGCSCGVCPAGGSAVPRSSLLYGGCSCGVCPAGGSAVPRSSLLYGGCSCGVCPAGGSAVLRSPLLYGGCSCGVCPAGGSAVPRSLLYGGCSCGVCPAGAVLSLAPLSCMVGVVVVCVLQGAVLSLAPLSCMGV